VIGEDNPMTMLIPFAGLSPAPWKNGGGSTTQIAVFPPDAGFEEFDWRVSLATIPMTARFPNSRASSAPWRWSTATA
jgi:environmental stress-induced protein Ves